jgi:hypothetical protein
MAKSIYTILSESIDKMTKQQRDTYYANKPKGASVETLINCAQAVLAGKVVSEAAPIVKHNGASDNGTEFRESAGGQITETITKSDAVLYKSLGISESDQRRLMGLPGENVKLTPNQLREYRFLRSIRLGEADALKGALKVS